MTSPIAIRFRRTIQFLLSLGVLLVWLNATPAQITKSTDGKTSKGIEPGAPAGSYPITEWENINLFNGQVSFTLPIVQKGRGGSGISLPIRISRMPWVVKHQRLEYPNPEGTGNGLYYDVFNSEPDWWNPTINRPFMPGGSLVGRYVGADAQDCYGTGFEYFYLRTNTRLTFTAPDGTEYTLIDREKGGEARIDTCSLSVDNYRGNVFVTADGTTATFYSQYQGSPYSYADAISTSDPYWTYGEQYFLPSGYVMLKDGTRYDIAAGKVTRMRDRNGNETTYQELTNGYIITDSLKRQIVIDYDVNEGGQYGTCDRITFKGFGGADRIIRISYTFSNGYLRTTQPGDPTSFWTGQQMFPELDNYGYLASPRQVAAIYLPDNRSYQFKYNVYQELARVELPTGGAIEYDYSGGELNGTASGVIGDYLMPRYPAPSGSVPFIGIYRRLVERRVYKTLDISSLEGKTTYSKPTLIYNGGDHTSEVLVEQWNPSGTTCLGRSKHYFLGSGYKSQMDNLYDSVGHESLLVGREYRTEVLQTTPSPTVLRQIEHTWSTGSFIPNTYWYAVPINPRITETKTTLVDANLVAKQTFTYSNDEYNNQTDAYEYDYGTGSPGAFVRRTHTDYVTTNNGVNYATDTSIHIRNLPSKTQVFSDEAGTVKKAETLYEYDNYTPDTYHAALVNRTNITSLDSGFTTSYTKRGNVTKVTNWRNTGGADISTYAQYDIAGNVVKTIDANGNATTIDFSDRFGSPTGDAQQNAVNGEGTYTTAPSVWLGSLTTYAFPTKVTNALGHIAYTQFDYFLGQVVDTEDPNGIKSSLYYQDTLDRPTKGIRAVGTSLVNQTVITYDDTNKMITVATDKDANQDGVLQSQALYDGLGRTWRKATYEGSNNWAIVETQFDALGRAYRSSKAFRDTSPTAALPADPEWTTSTFDALGRATQVTTPDGAHVDTAYDGNKVMVTDQAGKKRLSQTDALGRLLNVWEVTPADSWTTTIMFAGQNQTAYLTTYAYDTLDNLTTVTQGAQTRTFVYDSLKRLLSATNPESGTTSYTYDNNGNLLTKTDARTTMTTLAYDALNRVTSKTYSGTPGEGADAANATPPVYYKYDNQSFPSGAPSGFNRGFATGRLVAVTYGSSTTSTGSYFGYDELGRAVRKTQQINGTDYPITASYNLASMMTSESYPSTRTANYTYNTAGQLATFSGNIGDGTSRTYVGSVTYNAEGLKEREAYGVNTSGQPDGMSQPLYLKLHYNKRHQLVDLRLGSVNDEWNWNRGALIFYYGTNAVAQWNPFYDDTDNNGNVRRALHYVPTVVNGAGEVTSHAVPQLADYTYDALNRIASYSESQTANSGSSWSYNVAGQTFDYDRYGNRQITGTTGGVNNYNPSYTASTNRIVGLTYDSAGNLTNDGLKAMTYDAENHIVSASGGGGSGSYVYDGEGKRVKRAAAGQEWWYIYGLGGELMAEYPANGAASTPQIEYGYRHGELLIEGGCDAVRWRVTDQLGSTRMSVGSAGTLASVKRTDYLPFGEELGGGIRSATYGYAADCWRQKFTGYERDAETGLDFAQARYFSSVQGRFVSPDAFAGHAQDPQTQNRYVYVRNNPLRFIDPTGNVIDENFYEVYKNQQGSPVQLPPPPKPIIAPILSLPTSEVRGPDPFTPRPDHIFGFPITKVRNVLNENFQINRTYTGSLYGFGVVMVYYIVDQNENVYIDRGMTVKEEVVESSTYPRQLENVIPTSISQETTPGDLQDGLFFDFVAIAPSDRTSNDPQSVVRGEIIRKARDRGVPYSEARNFTTTSSQTFTVTFSDGSKLTRHNSNTRTFDSVSIKEVTVPNR